MSSVSYNSKFYYDFKYKLYWLEKRKTYIKNRHWKNKRKRIEEELRILFHIDVYGGGQ